MLSKSDSNTIGVLGDNILGKHIQDFGALGYSNAVKVLKEMQSKVLGKSDYNIMGDNTKKEHMQDNTKGKDMRTLATR